MRSTTAAAAGVTRAQGNVPQTVGARGLVLYRAIPQLVPGVREVCPWREGRVRARGRRGSCRRTLGRQGRDEPRQVRQTTSPLGLFVQDFVQDLKKRKHIVRVIICRLKHIPVEGLCANKYAMEQSVREIIYKWILVYASSLL